LSDFEKQLRRFRLRHIARLLPKDPLGIGVVLGYSALKINEVANIRRIAVGIRLRIRAEAIKADLEFA
jgi:vacuolar-type H+-ATPase subunit C/Vma6